MTLGRNGLIDSIEFLILELGVTKSLSLPAGQMNVGGDGDIFGLLFLLSQWDKREREREREKRKRKGRKLSSLSYSQILD